MKLHTRKWGCALGITLLIAVPVACAVLIGQAIRKPATSEDMVRALPLFPGASHVKYGVPNEPGSFSPLGDVAQVQFRSNDTPDAVLDFYSDSLSHDGWASRGAMLHPGQFFRSESYFSGLSLSGHAPWIALDRGNILQMAAVSASRVKENGEEFTEVTIELISGPPTILYYSP